MTNFAAQGNNPASRIEERYQELMGIDDVEVLRVKALFILAEGGVSPKNKEKFQRTVTEAPTLDRLRGYLTNYLLAGSGLAVV